MPTQNPIAFKWRDTFDKSGGGGGGLFGRGAPTAPPLTAMDSAFERVSILFNCAAMMSALASTSPYESDEKLQSMAKQYQV